MAARKHETASTASLNYETHGSSRDTEHSGPRPAQSMEYGRAHPISPAGAHRARVTAYGAGLCPWHAHSVCGPL